LKFGVVKVQAIGKGKERKDRHVDMETRGRSGGNQPVLPVPSPAGGGIEGRESAVNMPKSSSRAFWMTSE